VDNADSEQILGKLESYELFFTDKRLVYLNTPVKPQYMPVGNLVGWGLRYSLYRSKKKKAEQKQEEIKDLPLDEKLQEIKGSYAIAYGNIDEFVLSRSRSGGLMTIREKSGLRYFNFKSKEELNRIADLLKSITFLNGKIRVQ
jgi:hypothetical protein